MRKLIILLLVMLSSCSNRYIPVESIRHDSIYINKVKYDSIYNRDSIYIIDKGDTVIKYHKSISYKYKLVRDTVNISSIDTIRVPYPVEKQLSKWEKTKMYVGGLGISFCAAFIIASIFFKIRK